MSNERMQILEMVRDGKITAEEGVRLLEALQPRGAARATGGAGPTGVPGVDRDDPVGSIATAVAHAIQSGDWKSIIGHFAGSWSGGPMRGLERKREREADGWAFLTLSEGDHGTFELRPGDSLSVEHEAGSVEAAATDSAARLELEGEATHSFEIYVARKDANVVVVCHRTAPFAKLPRLKLSVPRGVTDVALNTAGGGLTAEAFSVPVHLKTAGGSVRVRDQRGSRVEAKTAGGSIKVNGTVDRVDLHTSGGSIKFEGRTGAFDVKTSGGSIHIDGAELKAGEHSAQTSGGSVHISLARQSSVELDAKTSAGNLTINLPGAEGERSGGRISPRYHGRYNGDGAKLSVSTSAGAVHIELAEESRAPSV